eukprot:CAMPEP_0202441624 /NCGR_PEP_ID=MMETSP1360-20130828/1144_1 /ASSEMBLY_ACC=CAM_ASM_000848 /TAXON_ID=515479 /ORGANISM="Licmophora paradoxa, Strain CCMP2313" /LENGTH=203 /DNA_ID=CAMNT_0049056689 /DNA_START=152 /DNA_END=763 /DNA_ORIENTATION=+
MTMMRVPFFRSRVPQQQQQQQQRFHPQQHDSELELINFVLEQFRDRPHVWNLVLSQAQRLQREEEHKLYSETKRVQELTKERVSPLPLFLLRRLRLRAGAASTATVRPQETSSSSSSSSSSLRWQREPPPNAKDRWEDVGRLDEVSDNVPEDSRVRILLDKMKRQCLDEARNLQRTNAQEHQKEQRRRRRQQQRQVDVPPPSQ